MLQTNKTEVVRLFGKSLLLSERTARDVNKLINFSKQSKEKNFTDVLIEATITVEDSLKINYKMIKPYCFIRKWYLKKLLSKESLLSRLTSAQIFELASKVYELEGIIQKDQKKSQVQGKGSVEMLQSV